MSTIQKLVLNNPNLNVMLSIVIAIIIFVVLLKVLRSIIKIAVIIIAILMIFNVSWFKVADTILENQQFKKYVDESTVRNTAEVLEAVRTSGFFDNFIPFRREYKLLKAIRKNGEFDRKLKKLEESGGLK